MNSGAPIAYKSIGFWRWLFPDGDAAHMTNRAWATLALISLLIMGGGLTSLPVMDRDEARYSQASKQMLESGNFVEIKFQEEARLVKPIGIYWMQAASASLLGGEDAPIAAYRLPSLLSAFVAVIATAWLGARIGGGSVGFTAGLLLAACMVLQIEARTAKTDTALLAAGVFAQSALYFLYRAGAAPKLKFWGPPAIFWAAHGLALMIKGPIIAMMSAATIVALKLFRKDHHWLHHLHPIRGLVLTAFIALPWVIAITIMTDGEFLQDSIGHALLGKVGKGDDSHGAPPGYHLVAFMGVFWPGAIFAALLNAYAWFNRQTDHGAFLLAWIWPTWIIFELVATKLPHYVMPVYPAVAILAGLSIHEAPKLLENVWVRRLHLLSIVIFIVVGLTFSAAAPAAARHLLNALPTSTIFAAVTGVATTGLGVWLAMRPTPPRLMALATGAAVFYIAVFGFAAPSLYPLWPSQQMARLVSQFEGCDVYQAATAGYREPSNIFYLGTETFLATTGAQAAEYLKKNEKCGVAFVEINANESFQSRASETGVAIRKIGEVRGISTVKGGPLNLTAYTSERSLIRLRK